MIRFLKMQGYWPPLVDAGVVQGSVIEVANHLIEIPTIIMPLLRHDSVTEVVAPVTPASAHAECDAGRILKSKINELLTSMETAAEGPTLEELKRNTRKSDVEAPGQGRWAGR
jgi:hypothetical protein